MIECHEHGMVTLGYIVCTHALAGATVVHRRAATGAGPGGLGEILCAACEDELPDISIDHLKLICDVCVARVFGPWH